MTIGTVLQNPVYGAVTPLAAYGFAMFMAKHRESTERALRGHMEREARRFEQETETDFLARKPMRADAGPARDRQVLHCVAIDWGFQAVSLAPGFVPLRGEAPGTSIGTRSR